MTSTLGYALLGLLARAPATGYDLSVRMRRPIGYFWSATHSQIYPELARLEAAGLLRHTVVDGAGPRPTKRYAITDEGCRELRDWAVSPPEPSAERSTTMLRVYSQWLADPAAAIRMVEQVHSMHRSRRAEYAALEAEAAHPDPGGDRSAFASYATLRAGIESENGALRWCEWLLDELRGDGTGSGDLPATPDAAGGTYPGRAD